MIYRTYMVRKLAVVGIVAMLLTVLPILFSSYDTYALNLNRIYSNDFDKDGIENIEDNCMYIENESQFDADIDGFGNACDVDFNDDDIVNDKDLDLLNDLIKKKLKLFDSEFDAVYDLNSDGEINNKDKNLFNKNHKIIKKENKKLSKSENTVSANNEDFTSLISGLSCAGSAPCPKPNFLIVYLDDTRADGIDLMNTVQNKLRDNGITFTNAFTPNAACCPSRASLYTGLYSINHRTRTSTGIIGGADTFRESGADQNTFAVWLDSAGYRNGLFGKYLNNYASTTEGDKGPGGSFYIPPGWDRWWAMIMFGYGGVHGWDYMVIDENKVKIPFNIHSTDVQYLTDVSAQNIIQFIEEVDNEGGSFTAVWVPWASHVSGPEFPHPADRHYDTLVGLPTHRPPNYNEEDLSDKPEWVRFQNDTIFKSSDILRQRAYETLLSVDEQIDNILAKLKELKIEKNTFIVFTSDNGAAWGEHGIHQQLKACPYEECQRVPFVVVYPNGVHPKLYGTSLYYPVLNIDIAPTISDIAGVSYPSDIDGSSIKNLLQGYLGLGWRGDYLIEFWRITREHTLSYTGLPQDGDKVRLFFGDTMTEPRRTAVFEFDSGNGVEEGSYRILLSPNSDEVFNRLKVIGNILLANDVLFSHDTKSNEIIASPKDTDETTYWWIDEDKKDKMSVKYTRPDYFGVRDVAEGYTYVKYETGEKELYDLNIDPYQLENVAGNPSYVLEEARLHSRLQELLFEIVN